MTAHLPASNDPSSDRRIFVQSSELRWVQFRAKTSVLTAEFLSGGIYEYRGVPKSKFAALLAADSKGTYFNAHIRGHHPYTRIS